MVVDFFRQGLTGVQGFQNQMAQQEAQQNLLTQQQLMNELAMQQAQQELAANIPAIRAEQLQQDLATGGAGGGGSTGELIRILQAENPQLTASDALSLIRGGAGRGLQFGEQGFQPIQGFGESLAQIGAMQRGAEAGAAEQARLQQQIELEPQVRTAVMSAEAREKGRQDLRTTRRSLNQLRTKNQFLNKKIDSVAARANRMTTGFGGSLFGAVPGTPAFDLRRDVETLLANAGFDTLQAMRDASPTGGALGQVSERELALLQSAAQNLEASQSREQFLRNLATFKEQRKIAFDNVKEAYEEDIKRFGRNSRAEERRQEFESPNIQNLTDEQLRAIIEGE